MPHHSPTRAGPPAGAPTRVAVVGAGAIAQTHLEVLSALPDVRVLAVVDPALDRARALAERFAVPRALGAVSELAAVGVDVAHVLVPPPLHAPVADELFGLGIGVLIEKPAALCAADVQRLAERARAAGLPFGVQHNHLFHPAFRRLRGRLERGEIGRLQHVQASWSMPLEQLDAGRTEHWMFAAPGNILFEQGPHPLSQVLALVGEVRELQARVLESLSLEDGRRFHTRWSVALVGEYASAEVLLGFGAPFACSRLVALGTDGCLEADLAHDALTAERKTPWLEFWNDYLAKRRRARALTRDATRGLAGYLRATLGFGPRCDPWFVSMREAIAAFYRALRRGEQPPIGAPEAEAVLSVLERIARSVGAEVSAGPREPALPFAESAPPGAVVVLGGTGFIGRRVVARLLERQRPLACVTRRAHALPPEIAAAARAGRLTLLRGSLEGAAELAPRLAGAQAVVHLATGDATTLQQALASMVAGSVALAEACAEAGVRRLVYVSSIAALDTTGGREISDEEGPDPRLFERSVYARAKGESEAALREVATRRGLGLVIARPAIVVGEGTPLQHTGYGLWVRDNHCVGWGRGEHPLPLVWVEDVAEALVRAAIHPGAELNGRAFNLAARTSLGARRIVEALRTVSGRDLVFHPRALALSHAMEVGKWLVKKVGRRRDAAFPSRHDLEARALNCRFRCEVAREQLDWRPLEDDELLLAVATRPYAPRGGVQQADPGPAPPAGGRRAEQEARA